MGLVSTTEELLQPACEVDVDLRFRTLRTPTSTEFSEHSSVLSVEDSPVSKKHFLKCEAEMVQYPLKVMLAFPPCNQSHNPMVCIRACLRVPRWPLLNLCWA